MTHPYREQAVDEEEIEFAMTDSTFEERMLWDTVIRIVVPEVNEVDIAVGWANRIVQRRREIFGRGEP